jgi:hypothetical protein
MDQLDRVTRRNCGSLQGGTPHDLPVVLDHDGSGIQPEVAQEVVQRGGPGQLARFSVDSDPNAGHAGK